MLEDSSRDHAIDVASRRMAVDALTPSFRVDGARYLDAGCSTGWLIDDVHAAYPRVRAVGADPFLSGLVKAQGRGARARFVQFDLCCAPFASNVFDAISCLNVLEHIEEDVQALKEIHRMLKPGGAAFIMAPAGAGLYDYYDEVHQHVRRYDQADLARKIQAAGLKALRIEHLGALLFPAFYAVKKLGQWRMKGKTMDEKRARVLENIRGSSNSVLAATAINIERRFSAILNLCFGIRLAVIVTKEAPRGAP